MKKITFLSIVFLTIMSSYAQTDAVDAVDVVEAIEAVEEARKETIVQETKKDTSYWKKGGSISLNFNNTSLSNWAAGGKSSVALGSIVDLFANYEKGKNNWVSNINWAAGMARVGDKKELLKKSDDQLILFSKFRRNIKPNWGLASFAELRTQVLSNPIYTTNPDSSNNAKREVKTNLFNSSFMSPGYLTTSIGWEYNKGTNFYLHASPLAGRGTFVLDDSLSNLPTPLYGLEKGKKVLFQFGSLVRSGFKLNVMENVSFASNLTLFTPYKSWGNIDVTWETLTTFKINKFLTTTFSTQLLYYDAARPKVSLDNKGAVIAGSQKHGIQFKHVLNIGFLAKF